LPACSVVEDSAILFKNFKLSALSVDETVMGDLVNGRLSLGWRDLTYIPEQLIAHFVTQQAAVKEIDLSHNQIKYACY